jgi:CHASE2 domain-containing sensor protein
MFETRSTLAQRAILLALALLFTGMLYRLARNAREWGPELAATSTLFRMRGPRPVRNDVLIIAVNNQNPKHKLLDSSGRVNRTTLATLVRRAKAGGAQAVVLDVYMPRRTTHAVDRDLWTAIASTPQNVFLPAEYDPARSNVLTRDDVRNLNYLEESVLTGSINAYGPPPGEYVWWKFVPPVSDFTHSAAGKAGGVGVAANDPDPDGVVRRVRLAYQTDIVYPPTTTATRLIRQGNVENVAVPGLVLPVVSHIVQVGKRNLIVNYEKNVSFAGNLNPPIQIPVDRAGRMLINYAGPYGTFPYINAADVLDGKVDRKRFDGKIVFIGVTEGALADVHPTPFGNSPRVDITVNGVVTVLDRAFLTQAVEDAIIPLGFLALFMALTLPFFTLLGATLWAILSLVGYGVIALFAFKSGTYGILPLVPALLLILLLWLSAVVLGSLLLPRRSVAVYS